MINTQSWTEKGVSATAFQESIIGLKLHNWNMVSDRKSCWKNEMNVIARENREI